MFGSTDDKINHYTPFRDSARAGELAPLRYSLSELPP
ncbi:hypothetical protein [Azospirillum argentinense]